VRMPWAQFGFNADGKRRFLDAFVQLKQVGVTGADANPDYFHDSSRRKSIDAFDRQKKRTKLNRIEFLAQSRLNIFTDFGEKAEREMDLIAGRPSNAAKVWIQRHQNIPDRFRRIDGNEQPA